MDKRYDLYITFPDELSVADGNLATLINSYIRNFTAILERIVLQKLNIAIKQIDFDKSNYSKFLNSSSLFIFFTHPSFEANQEYENELDEICNYLHLDHIDPLQGYSQIFNICLEPNKNPLKPASLDELLPYIFYEQNQFNRKIKSLDFELKEKSVTIYAKLLDLAYNCASSLNKIRNSDQVKSQDDSYIYLGLSSIDQQESREEIRRELQQLGYRILPLGNMPHTADELEQMMIINLNNSDAVIQIMGAQYGDILKGSKYSLHDFQNRVIKKYQEENQTHLLKRYIWIPAGYKISDQRQALYLKRIKRDDAGHNTEIIETPLETFKTIITARLINNKESASEDYENIYRVYLLTEEELSKEFEKLYATLSASGLKVTTLDYGEQIGIYARHLQKLRECDSIIIFQQKDNKYWLNSKLSDIIKSPGIGRMRPFKKVVIVAKSKPDEQLIRMIKTKTDIIYDTKFDEEQILHKLISE
jgi:hypothetical protein